MSAKSTLGRRTEKGAPEPPREHPYFDLIRDERRQREDALRAAAEQNERKAA